MPRIDLAASDTPCRPLNLVCLFSPGMWPLLQIWLHGELVKFIAPLRAVEPGHFGVFALQSVVAMLLAAVLTERATSRRLRTAALWLVAGLLLAPGMAIAYLVVLITIAGA